MPDRRQQRVRDPRPRARDARARCGCDGARLVEVAHLDQRAARGERRRDDRARAASATISRCALARDARRGARSSGVTQDRLRQLVVLRLREEVERDPVGVGRARRRSRGSRRRPRPCRCRRRRTRGASPPRRRRCPDRRSCRPRGSCRVPYASAAIACAPPIVNTRVTPARCAAASTSGLRTPSGVGTTMTISRTPATCAGIAFISTDDGYAALPPGHVDARRGRAA